MKFKCKVTNLVYNFEYEVDIMAMMKHPDYEAVAEEETPVEETKPVKTSSKKSKVATDETNIDGA